MQIEWILVLFTAISGTGAWLFAASMSGEIAGKQKRAPIIESIVALALLVVGGLLSVLHLAHPERILEALNRPASGIFVEAAFVGVLSLVIIVYLIMALRSAAPAVRRIIAVVGIALGLAFSFVCGSSYLMEARPHWNTVALPVAYLGTVAAAGTAFNLLIKALRKDEGTDRRFAGILVIAGSVLGIVTALIYLLMVGGSVFSLGSDSAVWIAVLFVALIAVGVSSILYIRDSDGGVGLTAVAAIGGIVGAIALRATMWLLGTGTLDFFDVL